MNEIDTEALYERVSAWIANAENNLERPGIPDQQCRADRDRQGSAD